MRKRDDCMPLGCCLRQASSLYMCICRLIRCLRQLIPVHLYTYEAPPPRPADPPKLGQKQQRSSLGNCARLSSCAPPILPPPPRPTQDVNGAVNSSWLAT